jgi:hypothetical protein
MRVDKIQEPYKVLNEPRPEGFRVEACATCVSFRFSGMTRAMAGGAAGYCAMNHLLVWMFRYTMSAQIIRL